MMSWLDCGVLSDSTAPSELRYSPKMLRVLRMVLHAQLRCWSLPCTCTPVPSKVGHRRDPLQLDEPAVYLSAAVRVATLDASGGLRACARTATIGGGARRLCSW